MLKKTSLPARIIAIGLALSFAVSCTVKLAPSYDEKIATGLTTALKESLILFAALEEGAPAESLPARKTACNSLQGTLEALRIQLKARPVPDTKYLDNAKKLLRERGLDAGSGNDPTDGALRGLLGIVAEIKRLDNAQGLSKTIVAAHRNAMILYFDQAITYESFLKR